MTNATLNNSTGDLRREGGRILFTNVLGFMLRDISHPEMALLADWACNEAGNLHTSQISHLRNAKMRMLGVKSLDALGRINEAAAAYKAGNRAALKGLDTAQTTARIEEILDRYDVVEHPTTGEPMNAGDLMMVYLGYIELPELVPAAAVDDKVLAKVAKEIGPWVEALIQERGLSFRDGLKMLSDKWTGSDAGRDKFCSVVAGMADYNVATIKPDLETIAKAVSALIDEDMTAADLSAAVAA